MRVHIHSSEDHRTTDLLLLFLVVVLSLCGCGRPQRVSLTPQEVEQKVNATGIQLVATNWSEAGFMLPIPSRWNVTKADEKSFFANRFSAPTNYILDLSVRIMPDPSILNVRNPKGSSGLKPVRSTRCEGTVVETSLVSPPDEYCAETTFAHTATNVVDGVFLLYLMRYPESQSDIIPELLLQIIRETKRIDPQ